MLLLCYPEEARSREIAPPTPSGGRRLKQDITMYVVQIGLEHTILLPLLQVPGL